MRATVATLHRNGTWDLPPARTDQELQLLTYLTTVDLSDQDDYYEWEQGGKITLKYQTGDVYSYLKGEIPEVNWAKAIWSAYGIPRHSFFAWLVIQNRCPTKDRLLSWGLQVQPLCLLCNLQPETRDHLFHECSFTAALWVPTAAKLGFTLPADWNGMVSQMITLLLSRATKAGTLLTWLVWKAILYWVWNERNSRLHTNSFRSVDSFYCVMDLQIRNKISSFRQANPVLASAMMQQWL